MSPKAPLHYRRRLRSRLIISFLLLGTGLTALFALGTVSLREQMESQLIGETLLGNLDDYASAYHADPTSGGVPFEKISGWTFHEHKFANVPLEWRDLDNGVHDLIGSSADGLERIYKLAVRKEARVWFFLRYDTTQERRSQERLQWALIGAVIAFSLLAYVLGVWSSRRVMQPVADLAARLGQFRNGSRPEPLAPHFADDEVGELAAAFDDYSYRLTELVKRDREFNADVSHELRTPLAVIRGATELLLAQPDLAAKSLTRLKRVERAVQQSSDLIEALLALSRGERGAGHADVRRVVEHIVESQRLGLSGKPLSLSVSGEIELGLQVPEAALAVALNNLVGNAVKYTPQGTIEVKIFRDRVEVHDNGPGIEPEDAPRVFERGYRGKGAEASKGAGIGLAIVTRLCDLYGWRASLASHAEGGVTATLEFCNTPRSQLPDRD